MCRIDLCLCCFFKIRFLILRLDCKACLFICPISSPLRKTGRSSVFPTRSDTNQAVQLQKMTRGLKFRIYKEEGMYYLCSENKDADQLCICEADLRLFRICKKPVFSRRE